MSVWRQQYRQQAFLSLLPQGGHHHRGTVSLATWASACIQTLPPNVSIGSKSWVLQLTFLEVLVILCFVLYGQVPNYICFWVYVCMLWNLRISLGNMWLWLNFSWFLALGSLFGDIILLKI